MACSQLFHVKQGRCSRMFHVKRGGRAKTAVRK